MKLDADTATARSPPATAASTACSSSGVRTTGIYCRPIARPARPGGPLRLLRARRRGRARGFRACLRCRPELAPARRRSTRRPASSPPPLARIDSGVPERALGRRARRRAWRHRPPPPPGGGEPRWRSSGRARPVPPHGAGEAAAAATRGCRSTEVALPRGSRACAASTPLFRARFGRLPRRCAARRPGAGRHALALRLDYARRSTGRPAQVLAARATAGVEGVRVGVTTGPCAMETGGMAQGDGGHGRPSLSGQTVDHASGGSLAVVARPARPSRPRRPARRHRPPPRPQSPAEGPVRAAGPARARSLRRVRVRGARRPRPAGDGPGRYHGGRPHGGAAREPVQTRTAGVVRLFPTPEAVSAQARKGWRGSACRGASPGARRAHERRQRGRRHPRPHANPAALKKRLCGSPDRTLDRRRGGDARARHPDAFPSGDLGIVRALGWAPPPRPRRGRSAGAPGGRTRPCTSGALSRKEGTDDLLPDSACHAIGTSSSPPPTRRSSRPAPRNEGPRVAAAHGGRHPLLECAARELREYFDGGRQAFEVPIALPGTPFERSGVDGAPRHPLRGDPVLLGLARLARPAAGRPRRRGGERQESDCRRRALPPRRRRRRVAHGLRGRGAREALAPRPRAPMGRPGSGSDAPGRA